MKRYIVLLLCLVLLCSCSEVYRYTNTSFFAMNTVADVVRSEELKDDYTEQVVAEIEKKMSRTLEDSEISRINNGEDIVLSDETLYVLEKSLEIARETDYAFNPCMGTLSDLWDITSGRNYVPTEDEINEALSLCDARLVTIEDGKVIKPDGLKIDLGGVAKGYALERACERMQEVSAEYSVNDDFCISLGGNVGVKGSSKSRKESGKTGWSVGITNPFDKQKIMGRLILGNGCVSVSGAYERFFEKDGKIYHHIFDPKTGYPSMSDLASAVVVSQDGLVGDALSTALFIMGKDKAIEFFKRDKYEFDVILITHDGNVYISEGIYDKFAIDEGFGDNVKIEIITG